MKILVAIQKAIDFINKNGSEYDKIKLKIILGEEIASSKAKLIEYYSILQNRDGGFPYLYQKNSISTINVTVYSILTMMDYGIIENNTFDSAIEFLYRNQYENGSWNESSALIELEPPFWDDPRKPYTPIWLTANTCFLLARLGFISSPILIKGINYLLKKRDPSGKIEGFLQATWLFAATLSLIHGNESKIVIELLDIINHNFEQIANSSDIIWCLQSLVDGGIPIKSNLIEKIIQNLLSQQKNNGKWSSNDGIEFDASTTVSVIYLLKKLGIID